MAPKIFTVSCDLSDIEVKAEYAALSQSSAAQTKPGTSLCATETGWKF